MTKPMPNITASHVKALRSAISADYDGMGLGYWAGRDTEQVLTDLLGVCASLVHCLHTGATEVDVTSEGIHCADCGERLRDCPHGRLELIVRDQHPPFTRCVDCYHIIRPDADATQA